MQTSLDTLGQQIQSLIGTAFPDFSNTHVWTTFEHARQNRHLDEMERLYARCQYALTWEERIKHARQ